MLSFALRLGMLICEMLLLPLNPLVSHRWWKHCLLHVSLLKPHFRVLTTEGALLALRVPLLL